MFDTKLREMRAKRAAGDKGFTLIELLVVVVIIGILVAIAIPLYLNYRKGAENKSAESDARNAVSAIEQCYTDNANVYPASQTSTGAGADLLFTCGTSDPETAVVSSGNTMVYTLNSTDTPVDYSVAVTNSDTNKTFTYTSNSGKIVES